VRVTYEFRVRDWARFQHYKKRDETGKPSRAPAWIKVYVKLLDDPAYLGLSGTQRALLHDVWLWWARMDLGERYVRLNVEMLNRVLSSDARISTWKALNHAGFLELRASSGTGDIPTPARAEEEKEEKELQNPSPTAVVNDVDPDEQILDELAARRRLAKGPGLVVNGRDGGAVIAELVADLQQRGARGGGT
jgi:hypothetical protein